MDEISKIVIEEFDKKRDGSWVCVRSSDIVSKSGIIRIPPGATFRRGVKLWGLDVAEALDEISANKRH
ncbi:hypothetical protein [Syntrophorhabdus aromaticivorans]|jgi:hypothetical protein|uniref:hypothetical protein n=1 Tax=Syntrophorhabdus aromaticivorans TaxID=328301 RepID=UPI00048D5B4C|nr:hypothetical protein [Syntrophorhabdus aromaticivorans]HQN18176.1 hypothetical protein [Syntrophobacteraceae bacterium]